MMISSKISDQRFNWVLSPGKGFKVEFFDRSSFSSFNTFNLHCVAEVEHKADEDDAQDVDGEGDHPEVDVAVEDADHLEEDDQCDE